MGPLSYDRRVRVSDVVYEQIRSEIIEWDLKPGASLGEIETAERVGVSRTPVREAFARLAAEGLVVTSGRTVRVAPLFVSKVNTAAQLAFATWVLAERAFGWTPGAIDTGAIGAVAALTLASAAAYLGPWIKHMGR